MEGIEVGRRRNLRREPPGELPSFLLRHRRLLPSFLPARTRSSTTPKKIPDNPSGSEEEEERKKKGRNRGIFFKTRARNSFPTMLPSTCKKKKSYFIRPRGTWHQSVALYSLGLVAGPAVESALLRPRVK